jgi:pimeloyl-ACP methyl ester carboxylesterase
VHVLTRALDGKDVPVLLVHGLASNARLWDGVADRLAAAGHPVAAVDQRGHGRSDRPDQGYDFTTLTVDLVAVLDDLGWRDGPRPWVAGQSWGANVVLELAAQHPGATGGVVLVDGGTIELRNHFADWQTCAAAMAPPELTGTPAAGFERVLRTRYPDWPESGIAATMANFEVLADGTMRPWLSRPHHMAILRHLWDHLPSTRYHLVTVPTLLLPAEDPANQRWMATKREEVWRAAATLPRSLTHWIAGDHDLHAQHPDLVAKLIEDAMDPASFP